MRGTGPRGFSLVALMAGITMAMLVLGAALPAWRYVVKDDREQELIFRGLQIAGAIKRFQDKTHALPPSLEVLVKGRYLRKAYKDPMAKDGKWRLIPQGGGAVPQAGPGSPPPTTRPAGPGGSSGGTFGAIAGVASVSTEKSIRKCNGQARYNLWTFKAGERFVCGTQAAGGPPAPTTKPTPK